jgi:hypothetical protein
VDDASLATFPRFRQGMVERAAMLGTPASAIRTMGGLAVRSSRYRSSSRLTW